MRKMYFVLVIAVSLLMACCKSKSNDSIKTIVGNDRDSHGCIGSAGYTWSEVLNECIRPWENGIRLFAVDNNTKNAVAVFSKDSLKVELFLSDGSKEILDRRKAAKGFVWNTESDDTYSLMNLDGWLVQKRGETRYK